MKKVDLGDLMRMVGTAEDQLGRSLIDSEIRQLFQKLERGGR